MLHFLQRLGACYIFPPCHDTSACLAQAVSIMFTFLPLRKSSCLDAVLTAPADVLLLCLLKEAVPWVWHCTLASGASWSAWGWDGWGHKGPSLRHKQVSSEFSPVPPAQQTALHACTSSTMNELQYVWADRFKTQPQRHHQWMQNTQ